jgi:hypothetical protein
MHRWAAELPQPMTATQLEWIMFTHNGNTAIAGGDAGLSE